MKNVLKIEKNEELNYEFGKQRACEKTRVFSFVLLLIVIIIAILHKKGIVPLTP